MTTYSKETALYDTGAIATDIATAALTADKYITKIDDSGIKVHAYDDTNEAADTNNYTRITSNGMEVFQNGESISSFGGSVRIGKNADAARVNISSTQLDIVTAEGVGALSVNLETEVTKTYGVMQYLDVPIKVLRQETQSVLLNLPSVITSGQVVYLPFKATLNGSVTGSAISQINKGTDKQGSVNLINSSGVRVASLSYSYSAANDTISVTNSSTGSVAVELDYFTYNRTATVPSISLNGEIDINGIKMLYEPGDSITYGEYESGLVITGFVTSSKTEDHYTIPLSKPCTASTVTITNFGIICRQNANYVHGTGATTYKTPSYTAALTGQDSDGAYTSIKVVCTWSNTSNVVNNAPIAANIRGVFTFA